jgi:SP family general alpha glucoside:H+ symporter-like MFS transporter
MVHTNEHEKYVSEGVGYLDCFRGVDLRRTEIISCVWMIQVWCGIWFGGVSQLFLSLSTIKILMTKLLIPYAS